MTTPTGSHATPKGSGRTPLPKAINQNVFDALKPYLINTHRAIVDGQGASGATVTTRSYGPCDAPTGIDAPTLIGYSTNVMMDGYTPPIPYEGGPQSGDPIRTMETTPGNPLHLGIVTVLAHKLPFLSASTKFGKGLTEKDYGKYDVTTPDGVLHTAPGTKDPIKTAPKIDLYLQASATLPAVGTGDQSVETLPGYDTPVYNTSALDFDATTDAAYVKWNPVHLKEDTQGRLDLSDAVLSELGGGGGNSYKSGYGIEINGVTPPTGVTLALATGTDLGTGLYDYIFTKRTSTHKESGPSAPLSITTTTGNQDVTVTLPALDPTGDPLTIGYSIYRSAVGGTGTPISQCSGITSTVDGTGKTTYQFQIPSSYLLSYDPSVLAVDGVPPLPIDPATGLACTFDSGTGLFMSGLAVFDATLLQTYTSGQGYTFVADHGAGAYTDTASDASIAANKRPPGDNTPEIDTLLATVDETLHSPLKSGLVNTGPSGGLLPEGRGLKINPAVVGGTDVSGIVINAGDDANGVQVTGPCPLYLRCAPVNNEFHAALNMGPGPWDGSGGGYDLGGVEHGYIALQVDPTTFPNLIDIRRAANTSTVDFYQIAANPGTSSPWDGTIHAPHVDVQYRGDTVIQGQHFLFQAPTTGIASTIKARAEFDGEIVFDFDNRVGGGQFLCYVDAFFNGALTTSDVLSAAITADSLVTGIANPGTGVQASGTSVLPAGINTPSIVLTGNATLVNYGRSDHKAISAPATPASGSTSLYSRTVSGTTKLFYKDDGGTEHDLASGSGGTVTSVGLSAPAFLTVGGSPVTGSGTLALTLATQTANTVFAGPTSGGAAAPTFRGLAAADVPDLSATYALAGTTGGAGELLVADGVTSPPVALYTEDGTDFLFAG